ncbi:MAG: class I SAM-dependent methyltransferase [Kofleriaceae bacterium]
MAATLTNLETYEQIAHAYAARTRENPHNALCERPATLALLGDLDGERMLEVGCGPGHYAEELVRRGCILDSFDINPTFVAQTHARVGDRAHVFVHDVAAPWSFASSPTYDQILAALVLDYVDDWSGILAECRRVLRPGGAVVASIVHPFASIEASPSKDYFRQEVIEERWPSYGVTIRCFRRSLTDVFGAFIGAGFTIDALIEPAPLPECAERYPEKFQRLTARPGFLCLRAH